jgi:hypothetical protein
MPLVRVSCTPDPFLLTCPVCGCRSWDRDGQELRCRACAVCVTLTEDASGQQALLAVRGHTLSPGGAAWPSVR